MRERLFSVTADDCDWQSMTAGGPGGQHQNRSQTAVRVTHRASGAVGVSREFKSQIQNKRAAFRRMAMTDTFMAWIRLESARLSGRPSIDEEVEAALAPRFLRVETRDEQGRWQVAE